MDPERSVGATLQRTLAQHVDDIPFARKHSNNGETEDGLVDGGHTHHVAEKVDHLLGTRQPTEVDPRGGFLSRANGLQRLLQPVD